jgi:hypothetical protein
MTTETEIEALIQAKGLTRPRLTPQDVDETIKAETYTTLPSGKVMVCELTLRNGFTVRGEAAVVSKANFNEEVGRKISRENARNKVWELEGYLLQQRLYDDLHESPGRRTGLNAAMPAPHVLAPANGLTKLQRSV